jgi:nucleotide-binding universal stress UspA family protein
LSYKKGDAVTDMNNSTNNIQPELSRELTLFHLVMMGAGILISYAQTLAVARQAEIVLMSVVTVPNQVPLSAAKKFVSEKHNLIAKVKKDIKIDQPVHSIIRLSHSVARGIISSVKDKKTDLLILGWKGIVGRGYEMGSNLDNVIENIPCDLMVIKPGKKKREIKKILLPSNGGCHSMMAAELARNLAAAHGARVTLMNVNRGGKEDISRIKRRLRPIMKQCNGNPFDLKIVDGRDVVKTIVNEAREYDVVILGATNEGLFQQMLFGRVPERITSSCENTVILVKKDMGMRLWLKRWLGKRHP